MEGILRKARPVIPVLTIERVEDAVPLARALVAGGLPVLEVTLRTAASVAAIEAIQADVPEATVGAGTVTRVAQLKQLEQLGCCFAVSPGATPDLLLAGCEIAFPFLPAVATVSEMMVAMQFGYQCFKFFPAFANGGPPALQTIAGPFPKARFCPTGSISGENFIDYLALSNVVCVGGSWMAPATAIASREWHTIEQLTRQAIHTARQQGVA